MDQKRLKTFEDRLNRKRREILEVYTRNKGYGREGEPAGAQDVGDRAASSYNRDVLFSLSSSERDMLQAVEDALDRLGRGQFGVCLACQGAVDRKRLEAVPWARHCLPCQEKQEQGHL